MSNSWAHEVRPLNDHERAFVFATDLEQPSFVNPLTWSVDKQRWLAERRRCSVRCANDVAYVVSYRYITGRAGRVGFADKRVCAEHAAKFAKNHGLAMP